MHCVAGGNSASNTAMDGTPIRLIGSCPSLGAFNSGADYRTAIERLAGWADADGWEAVLIYTDHRQLDPWLVAQLILEHTQQLCPLVAIQPLYMHPFTLAQNIYSLAFLYGRQVCLNLVAGGFPRDLETLGDQTPHDKRYDRLIEYATIVDSLLNKRGLTTFSGEFYRVKNLQLPSVLPEVLRPAVMISGSSDAGLTVARKLGARAIQYLLPSQEYTERCFDPQLQYGTRLGVVIRKTTEEAWAAAHERYPPNPAGALVRQYAMSISDSVWVKELSKEIRVPAGHPYWLGPYQNGHASCPFLVGNPREIATELANYLRIGLTTFLLEVPESAEDSHCITEVFRRAFTMAHPS